MSQIELNINREILSLDVPADMPLLWLLRDRLNLVGTKYGCGIGMCGCCTVLIDGEPMQSCSVLAVNLEGRKITTIEGLSAHGDHPVQIAWNLEDVPQCGYCQGGQLLTAAALLENNPDPSDDEIDSAMYGVVCRCGTYGRIRKAIKRAAGHAEEPGGAV